MRPGRDVLHTAMTDFSNDECSSPRFELAFLSRARKSAIALTCRCCALEDGATNQAALSDDAADQSALCVTDCEGLLISGAGCPSVDLDWGS
jgi:hypothetical protein